MVIQPKKITFGSALNKPHSVLNYNILEQINEENNISGVSPNKDDVNEIENNNALNTSKRSKKSSIKSHEKSKEISER